MIVGTLEMLGFVVIAGGIWCRLTGCVHAATVYGMYVLGDLLVFAAMVLCGAWLAAALWGASVVYWTWKWWRNRRKGGGPARTTGPRCQVQGEARVHGCPSRPVADTATHWRVLMTAICAPCADAADSSKPGVGHHPEVCRDFAIQPYGCPCGHQPAGTATDDQEDHNA